MTYLSADDVADLHEVVVDDVGQVVGREPVVFHDDLVVDCAVVEDDLAMHDVLELSLSARHLHPHDETLPTSLALLDFFPGQLEAGAVILRFGVLLAA